MIRKIYFFPVLFAALCLSLASCVDNDDSNAIIDEDWKALNEKLFNDALATGEYDKLSSQSGNGEILVMKDEFMEPGFDDAGSNLRVSVQGNPEFTDTVKVRYEGWYFNAAGDKVIFDSTENPSLRTQIDYSLNLAPSPYPNKVAQKFSVSPGEIVLDGWTTVLQYMTVGEEREIVVPQQLGYGSVPSTYTPSSTTYTLIPGYTTLRFRLKLLDIIPMSGLSN